MRLSFQLLVPLASSFLCGLSSGQDAVLEGHIEDCPVAAYDAGRFQTLHACEARRFGKPDAAGQLRHAETPVDRQHAENFRIDAVYWTIRHDSVRRFDQNRNKKSLIYGSEPAVKSKRLKNLCETDPVSMQR